MDDITQKSERESIFGGNEFYEQNQPGLSTQEWLGGQSASARIPYPPPPAQYQSRPTPRPQMRQEMKGPETANIDSILSGLNKEKNKNINVDNNSAISIDELNFLAGESGGSKRGKNKRKSDKNTIALAI